MQGGGPTRGAPVADDDWSGRRPDVLVLGAGVAGCACAVALAERGIRAAVLERRRPDEDPSDYGEILPPEGVSLLHRLGFAEEEGVLGERCFGVQSAWGGAALKTRTFASSLPPYGLRLSKPRFVRAMRARVLAGGTPIHFRASPVSEPQVRPDVAGRSVGVRAADGRLDAYTPGIVVDATGRARAFAGRRSPVQRFDRLVASVAVVDAGGVAANEASAAMGLTESVPTGWWYTSARPDGRRVVARFSDAHDRIARMLRDPGAFVASLRDTRWIASLVALANPVPSVMTASAASARLERIAGPDWIAIGDAAASVDPLSSQGNTNALRDALEVAEALGSRETPSALNAAASAIASRYAAYLDRREMVYALEERWRQEPFWRLRLP